MLSLSTILRGTLARFLPALIVGFSVIYALASLTDRTTIGWLPVVTAYVLVTLGYFLALMTLRFRLRADAGVAGRRSVVAGLLAPSAAFLGILGVAPNSELAAIVTFFAVGAALAVGMFFPWLKTSPALALTDQETQALLSETRPDLFDLDRAEVHESADLRKPR
ncbi:MAG TPA: hypothetical protein PLL69_06485 [Gemmatimonadales bacterium]|nr:hypothetical protein [Gemmatimonadales bacterium]